MQRTTSTKPWNNINTPTIGMRPLNGHTIGPSGLFAERSPSRYESLK